MSDKKQVPPPFGKQTGTEKNEPVTTLPSSPVQFSEGPIPVEDPVVRKQEGVLATLFEEQPSAEPSSSEPASERRVVEQSDEQMAGNVDEYWLNGTIGGLSLGNKSGGAAPANPFKAPPPNPKNPFQRTDKVVVPVVQDPLFDVPEGTPSWRDVVAFVMVHGKDIQSIRYPNAPRNQEVIGLGKGWTTVIDTVWKGVPVINGEKCQIQHVKYGWAEWEDCQ